jgi:hypothetical protein
MEDISKQMNSFENFFDQDYEDYNEDDIDYQDDDVWDEDFSNNWNYWRTRWNTVELDQVIENDIDLEELEIQDELKEHQIYFLGLPEDVQKMIYNFVNPTHNYTYSS